MQKQSNNTVNRFVDTFENLARTERKIQPALGIKNSAVRVLLCIGSLSHDKQQVINVSQISNKLQVTSPTVTELIKNLSSKGYIERCTDAKDKRVVDIKLTSKGEKFVQKVLSYYDTLFSGLIERLGEEQSEKLVELLDQVCLYLNETTIDIE
mgnify:CR=1 FL=1